MTCVLPRSEPCRINGLVSPVKLVVIAIAKWSARAQFRSVFASLPPGWSLRFALWRASEQKVWHINLRIVGLRASSVGMDGLVLMVHAPYHYEVGSRIRYIA
jgi:hypothetical protein